MPLPDQLPTFPFVAGDDLTISLWFPGKDLTDKTFVSYIKAAKNDSVHVEFTVETYLVGADTWIVLTLAGDTALGEEDGLTRQIALHSYFDIQPFSAGGAQEPTLFFGELDGEMDVTR